MNNLLTHLVARENELERKRTRSLATQSWGDVIDADARISECKKMRKWIADEETARLPSQEGRGMP